ncbi:hypothetical protein LTR86_000171 [Recurvomyces mirabilis]|nr:hypothetical protein LTR86_000171 [Recurvomyces mirabilis]
MLYPYGIGTLSKYGLDSASSTTSQEALRCLANAFLLNEPSRQTFVDLGHATKAVDRFKNDNLDDEFLISRILFLMTYNTQLNFQTLVDDHQLADSIIQHISRHAKSFAKGSRGKAPAPPMQDAAMTETLKLLFNITYYYPDLIETFTPAIDPLISLVMHHPLATPPLQAPTTYILNALMNMNLQGAEKRTPIGREARTSPLFPYANPESVVDRLISIFDNAIKSHPEPELDQAAAPLCTLIRRAYELANPRMQSWMRWILLPREKDRDKPLGQGEMLSSRLLRLSCSPTLPTLRENISSLLFELSDKDANTFVRNIGYGFASGFLMSHNIAIPANAAEAHSLRSEEDASSDGEINPVTGQKFSAETTHVSSSMTDMTEEEKEREAERLFVLFERLRATGVVDVKNPVQQAVDEGRFEELPD